MKEYWNERYSAQDYAYGKEPNVFFKQQLDLLNPGKILLPADGEGRNSVYAAKMGWEVFACDLSEEGQRKTEDLALQSDVTIQYRVGDFGLIKYGVAQFDSIALIYAHFQVDKKKEYLQMVNNYLKPGGTIIFEAFGKNHLHYNSVNPKVGGPKEEAMLYSAEELKTNFPNYEIQLLEETTVSLNEGAYHMGTGFVVRFVAKGGK